jgi:hypothetical protein
MEGLFSTSDGVLFIDRLSDLHAWIATLHQVDKIDVSCKVRWTYFVSYLPNLYSFITVHYNLLAPGLTSKDYTRCCSVWAPMAAIDTSRIWWYDFFLFF